MSGLAFVALVFWSMFVLAFAFYRIGKADARDRIICEIERRWKAGNMTDDAVDQLISLRDWIEERGGEG